MVINHSAVSKSQMKSSNSSVQKLIDQNNNESFPIEKLLSKYSISKNPNSPKKQIQLNTDSILFQSMKIKQENINNNNHSLSAYKNNYDLDNNDFIYNRKIHKSDKLDDIENNSKSNNKNNVDSISNNNIKSEKQNNKKKIVFTNSGYFEFKTNIRQKNFSLVHNNLIPKTSNEKSLWLSSPIEKNFWFKGKIKTLQDTRSNDGILYKYYTDNEDLLLLSAVKKGKIYNFYVNDDFKIKVGTMKCCNLMGNKFKINQYINKFYTEINYQLNIFGLYGPLKLKILVKNENTNEYNSKDPIFNACK